MTWPCLEVRSGWTSMHFMRLNAIKIPKMQGEDKLLGDGTDNLKTVLSPLPSPIFHPQRLGWRSFSIRHQFSEISNTLKSLTLTLFKILDFLCFLLFSSKYTSIKLPIGKEQKDVQLFHFEGSKTVPISVCLFISKLITFQQKHNAWEFIKASSLFSFPWYIFYVNRTWLFMKNSSMLSYLGF